jgi:hypothetical protein
MIRRRTQIHSAEESAESAAVEVMATEKSAAAVEVMASERPRSTRETVLRETLAAREMASAMLRTRRRRNCQHAHQHHGNR